ncbi:MAG: hypothetical protein WA885_07520 [Phormidesmis sp.]
MKPQFSTLIVLTLVCAVLLVPFALSPMYLDVLRDRSFDLHQFLRGEVYKQGTGFAALVLIAIEMLLSLRKRSRSLPIKVKVPGAVMLWRTIHIFTGVALLAFVLLHTVGASGLNFNAILLWIFFGVTLTALVGVVAETGILESPRKVFSFSGQKVVEGEAVGMGKGALIRKMRGVWLPSHILLVSIFGLMLAFHIFLVYYFR